MKRCSPPCAAITSSPGRSHRWKVLPSTICAPIVVQLVGRHRLDRAVGADRHERRRLDAAVRELEPAAARGARRWRGPKTAWTERERRCQRRRGARALPRGERAEQRAPSVREPPRERRASRRFATAPSVEAAMRNWLRRSRTRSPTRGRSRRRSRCRTCRWTGSAARSRRGSRRRRRRPGRRSPGSAPPAGVRLRPVGDDDRTRLRLVAAAEALSTNSDVTPAVSGCGDDRRGVERPRRIRRAGAVGGVRDRSSPAPPSRAAWSGGRAVAAVLVVERAEHHGADPSWRTAPTTLPTAVALPNVPSSNTRSTS